MIDLFHERKSKFLVNACMFEIGLQRKLDHANVLLIFSVRRLYREVWSRDHYSSGVSG